MPTQHGRKLQGQTPDSQMVVKNFCANETATRDDLIARANSNTLRK
jgi:hypothetical protein